MLYNKKDIDVVSATKDLVFTDDDIFDYRNGFNVAAAFTTYDEIYDWELPPRIGQLVINAFQWGNDENGNSFTKRARLNSHVCSKEELNISGEEPADPDENRFQFFKAHPNAENFVTKYQKKFICVDKQDLQIYGDFN